MTAGATSFSSLDKRRAGWRRYSRQFHRAVRMLRARGIGGFLRFAFGRLVYRRWVTCVYAEDATLPRAAVEWPAGYRYEFCDSLAALRDRIAAAENAAKFHDFLSDLDSRDGGYLVWYGRGLVSYGGVFDRSPQCALLGIPASALLIGGCHTVTEHRGRGLYRRALEETARLLRQKGMHDIYIEVHPENAASIAGIRRAGFLYRRTVAAQVWFGRLIRRDGEWAWLRKSH